MLLNFRSPLTLTALFLLIHIVVPTVMPLEAWGSPSSSPRPHILIDPGHGGRDIGAQVDLYKESEVVWKWALILKRQLLELGFDVSLSREENEGLSHEARVGKLRQNSYDFVLSLHANYLHDPRVRGVEYFILSPLSLDDQKLFLAHEETKLTHKLKRRNDTDTTNDSFDKKVQITTIVEDLKKQALMKKSLNIARQLQREWKGKLKQGPFDILNQAQVPAVLIELGFLSSPVDQKNLIDTHFITQQSRIMAKTLAKVFAPQKNQDLNP